MDREIIRLDKVYFSYDSASSPAVQQVSLALRRGRHLALLGHNGSGKSTVARLTNALELPSHGQVYLEGLPIENEAQVYELRRRCGMVFQNPDNQIVGTTVEEDTAFGPENLGLDTAVIRQRVDESLALVGLSALAEKPPNELSGGQKQKLAIAGVLAMRPDCMVLDEATAMLDPQTSEDLLQFVDQLCKEQGLSILHITHDMHEALLADEVLLLSDGRIKAQGSPREIFSQRALLHEEQLGLPMHLSLLAKLPPTFDSSVEGRQAFTLEEVFTVLTRELAPYHDPRKAWPAPEGPAPVPEDPVIEVSDLSHAYHLGSSKEHPSLEGLSFSVHRGEILAICGPSGSGKSTLISHFNALIRPQEGTVRVLGRSCKQPKDIPAIRQATGLVFQYPESQLFEATVQEDIAFGPKLMGFSEERLQGAIKAACELLQIDQEMLESSPFKLSGGQKRRVAIAGILAMEPEILVLDEPAAGLDPAGRREILRYIEQLREAGKTIVMVTHHMDEALAISDRVLFLHEGRLLGLGPSQRLFYDSALLERAGLAMPRLALFLKRFNAHFGCHWQLPSVSAWAKAIHELVEEKRDV